jgi:DNA-binding transcriptional ArsR family regulator
MTIQAPALHRALAVLAPPKRFQLMLLLLTGPDRSVSQLARAVRLSQSCTTRHLQALARVGLVKGTRDGKRVVFRPAPRDATATEVIQSLAGLAGLEGHGGAARRDDVLAAGIALGAVPVASTAELEPRGERERSRPRAPARERRPRPDADVPPLVAELTQDEPESAIKSDALPSPAWQRSEIEDFLL